MRAQPEGNVAAATPASSESSTIEPTSNARFINRELAWLAFNERVLEEASNQRHPIFERLRFLAISAINLDEFYMVRVAGLRGQVQAGVPHRSFDGLAPDEQLTRVVKAATTLIERQEEAWRNLRRELADAGINVIYPTDMDDSRPRLVGTAFPNAYLSVLTPFAIDPAHPFPFIPNFGFGVVLELAHREDATLRNALIRVPTQIGRFVKLPGNGDRFITVENTIELFFDKPFSELSGRFPRLVSNYPRQ